MSVMFAAPLTRALLLIAAASAVGGIEITAGKLSLSFAANGALESIATKTGGGKYYTRAVEAAGTAVDNATAVSSTVTHNKTSVCVRRVLKVGSRPLAIADCFQPSARATDAVEWTSTISSSDPSTWSAAIRRTLGFKSIPVSEEFWIPADTATTNSGSSNFLLATYPVSEIGAQKFWLGGLLTTPADGCNGGGRSGACSGAYAFSGPTLSVPVVATLAKPADSGLVMALNLDDFLSTQLSLQTLQNGWSWGYEQYRLGAESAPLVLRADLAAIPADARAAAGFVASRHPTFFQPAVAAATTLASGTSWYSKCGPAVGGCDLMASNQTFADELQEIAFKWVWNNNFAEYFMGNCELEPCSLSTSLPRMMRLPHSQRHYSRRYPTGDQQLRDLRIRRWRASVC